MRCDSVGVCVGMSRGKVGMEHAVMAAAQVMERVVDEQLAAMEDVGDDDLKRIRMERVRTMKKKKEDEKKWREREHGVVQDLPDEKAFFDALKGEERFVCHFYRENRPCKVSETTVRPTQTGRRTRRGLGPPPRRPTRREEQPATPAWKARRTTWFDGTMRSIRASSQFECGARNCTR